MSRWIFLLVTLVSTALLERVSAGQPLVWRDNGRMLVVPDRIEIGPDGSAQVIVHEVGPLRDGELLPPLPREIEVWTTRGGERIRGIEFDKNSLDPFHYPSFVWWNGESFEIINAVRSTIVCFGRVDPAAAKARVGELEVPEWSHSVRAFYFADPRSLIREPPTRSNDESAVPQRPSDRPGHPIIRRDGEQFLVVPDRLEIDSQGAVRVVDYKLGPLPPDEPLPPLPQTIAVWTERDGTRFRGFQLVADARGDCWHPSYVWWNGESYEARKAVWMTVRRPVLPDAGSAPRGQTSAHEAGQWAPVWTRSIRACYTDPTVP